MVADPLSPEAGRAADVDAEHLLYERAKPSPSGTGPLRLTPLELLDRLAALVPPPRVHHHRSGPSSRRPLRLGAAARPPL
jgi:hypothetical protein